MRFVVMVQVNTAGGAVWHRRVIHSPVGLCLDALLRLSQRAGGHIEPNVRASSAPDSSLSPTRTVDGESSQVGGLP